MYRGCPSWSAHGIGRPTGPGGGAHQKWVQCPNPAGTYHRSRVTHAGSYLHTVCAFCSQLYSWQLRVTCSIWFVLWVNLIGWLVGWQSQNHIKFVGMSYVSINRWTTLTARAALPPFFHGQKAIRKNYSWIVLLRRSFNSCMHMPSVVSF